MMRHHHARTRFRWATVLVALLSVAAADGQRQPRTPPKPNLPIIQDYLVPGAWAVGYDCLVVRRPTVAYMFPEGGVVLRKLQEGESVRVLEHDLYVWPQVVTVVYPHGPFRVGTKFYLLAYEEEGYRRVWFNGKEDAEYDFIHEELIGQGSCKKPSKDCWLRAGPEGREAWHVQVQLGDCQTGWITDPESFSERAPEACPRTGASLCRPLDQ